MSTITRQVLTVYSTLALVMMLSVFTHQAVAAENHVFEIAYANDKGFSPRTEPSIGAEHDNNYVLKNGQPIKVICETEGSMAESDRSASDIWEKLEDGTYVPNVFVYTGVDDWTPNIPRCNEKKPEKKKEYSRLGAAIYAHEYANTIDLLIAQDCTRFVSWSLWYGGGLPMTEDWSPHSKDPKKVAKSWLLKDHTVAAVNANEFTRYMKNSGTAEVKEVAWSDNTAGGAELGDIIAYDWDSGADGKIDHLAIVTDFTKEHYPYVTQHSPNQIDRYWSYSATEKNWIEYASPGSKAYLIHIIK